MSAPEPDGAPRAIRTRGLTKRFGGGSGGVAAVTDLDLDVREGDRYGFLGPNGSGKTTTVRMLLGLVLPTAGTAEVLGGRVPRDLPQVLPQVGAVVESPAALPHLSGRANLLLLDAAGPAPRDGPAGDPAGGPVTDLGRRTRRRRVDEVLEVVGLAGVGRRPVGAYSLGMRQRLGLAAALVRRPRLLVLDEPTNGLDPQGIRDVGDLLLGLSATGTTIFLSSHLLAEVEHLCTTVGVMDRGRLVVSGAVADLRRPTGRLLLRVGDPAAAASALGGGAGGAGWVGGAGLDVAPDGEGRLVVTAAATSTARPDGDGRGAPSLAPRVVAALVRAGVDVHEVVVERSTLEDVVLASTTAVGGS